jgi:phosphoribosylanthranilate isomerase
VTDVAVPQIKICGVTSLRDAQLVLDAGADALGLIYATSVRQVVGDVAGDIVERYGHQLWCVGVFRHQENHEILRLVDRDRLKIVQLHDRADVELLEALGSRGVTVIRAVSTTQPELSAHESAAVVAVIVDSPQPGSGVANDWSVVRSLHFGVPVLVAGGLTPDTVTGVITATSCWGVDVVSGVELSHGVKDPAKVTSFLTRARAALTQKGVQ